MSPGEIAWRALSVARDALDRGRFPLGLYPSMARVASPEAVRDGEPPFRVSGLHVGAWRDRRPGDAEYAWLGALRERAERIAAHRLTFFTLEDRHLGDPIRWNRDHEHDIPSPLGFAPAIDYRDYASTGDAKLVWEPNRHHHLAVLGRAYRATGDRRFADAIVEQMDSWMAQCPFGRGMNWRSPLELAIRLINWVWAADLVRESGALDGAVWPRLLHAVYLHLWEITRKYSRGSSANNHRIGEAAGVFVASSYFPRLPEAARWRAASQAILADEILAQTYPDGCTREQAFGYHLFVLQFFLVAGLVARWTHRDFPAAYWKRLEGMCEFVSAMIESHGGPPRFGDADDGYVLDLDQRPSDAKSLLAVGAVLFERKDFARSAGACSEAVWWLLGAAAASTFASLLETGDRPPVASRSFPDAGYYLLQRQDRGTDDRISVMFDCGELGFGPIAAHGHADALGFTLRASGADVFVDPGTYDYFTYPAWRDYFRSTRAHNTVTVDGLDQSEMLGPFLWGQRAVSRCVSWIPTPLGGTVVGEHDGYQRLPDPVMHRRQLDLDGRPATLTVTDIITASRAHDVGLYFHLAPHCRVSRLESNRYEISAGERRLVFRIDPRLSVAVLHGSEQPIAGWTSDGYHRRHRATTFVCTGRFSGGVTLVSTIEVPLVHRSTV